MEDISKIVMEHKQNLKPGDPQLNYCDRAVMVSGQPMIITMDLFPPCRTGRLQAVKH